jgi:hypothetical protein
LADLMELVFTKRAGKYDDLAITRADGTTERIQCPKQRIIPHDMVHFAVETVMVQEGFLTKVAAGETSLGKMVSDATAESIERLVEVMQGEAWSGEVATGEVLSLYVVACEAWGHAASPVSADQVDLIRAEMAALTERWDATPVHGSMVLRLEAA